MAGARAGLRGRPLTAGERALALSVFGEALDLDRVQLHAHGLGGFAVTLGRRVLFPDAPPADLSAAPVRAQAWLVHELVHVWQFQTAPGRTLLSWARTAAAGGYRRGLPGSRYPWPPPPWEALNLEQQASLVEHAFLEREAQPRFGASGQEQGAQGKGASPTRYAGLTPFDRLS